MRFMEVFWETTVKQYNTTRILQNYVKTLKIEYRNSINNKDVSIMY